MVMALAIGGCSDPGVTDPTVTMEPAGPNCASGGVKIQVGSGTPTYVCNGVAGVDAPPSVAVDAPPSVAGVDAPPSVAGVDAPPSVAVDAPPSVAVDAPPSVAGVDADPGAVVTCSEGEVFNPAGGDLDWATVNTGATFPPPGGSIQALATAGTAVRFVPAINRGIVGLAGYGPGAGENKELVISQCPHNFTNSASGQPLYFCRREGFDSLFQWISVEGLIVGNECTLTSGQTYYVNVRPASKAGETSFALGFSVQ